MAFNTLPAELAARAELIVITLIKRDYQYNGLNDADNGIYDRDYNRHRAGQPAHRTVICRITRKYDKFVRMIEWSFNDADATKSVSSKLDSVPFHL